jgi:hypothetical protein
LAPGGAPPFPGGTKGARGRGGSLPGVKTREEHKRLTRPVDDLQPFDSASRTEKTGFSQPQKLAARPAPDEGKQSGCAVRGDWELTSTLNKLECFKQAETALNTISMG